MAYTTIDDPSAYFNTLIWSGDNASPRSLTGLGFSPDWTWIKSRSDSAGHSLHDSVRGANKRLNSGDTAAEVTDHQFGRISSFDSDGFTLEEGTYTNYESGDTNMTGRTYVGWSWRASDSNAVSNTDGSITSTVSANTTAGFSIITYTGNGTAGATIGHGLGKVPKWILQKSRERTDYNWQVYHEKVASDPETDFLRLNTTAAVADNDTVWNDTAPTSSVITLGNNIGGNANGEGIVVYAFAEIEGYSKFGSYTGNGATPGPFVYTGFKPAWVMIKRSSGTSQWEIHDNKRPGYNPTDFLLAESTSAENTGADAIDFLSNGFKCNTGSRDNTNSNGSTHIYMAFAEHPFVSSKGVPVTAR